MKHTLTALALAGMIGVSSQAAASLPLAEAEIDWSSFTVTLFDLDPLDAVTPYITFIDHTTDVYANDLFNWWDSDWSGDWTTPISAALGPAQSSADGGLLYAATHGPGTAGARRWANFLLSPMTLVAFSANGSVQVAGGMGQFAWANVSTSGTGASGTGWQSGSGQLHVNEWSSVFVETGTLTASFLNLTGNDLSGEFGVSAYATAPIPEPEIYAMMLAGLGLVAWMVRRRRA